uniref:START domain-containing protein n=1 Tax=Hyaloperonospora arabidopsidis (strain Emoy2) TaxID=559515 RepID=M4C2F2_HYAAE
MEGWLTKRRDHMNLIWRDRYFLLDGNQLRYFRKRGDLAPRGTYILTDNCVVSPVFNSEEKHKHHGPVWMFRITFCAVGDATPSGSSGMEKSYKKDRFLDLGAKSEEHAREWKRALENAVRSLQELVAHQRKLKTDAEIFPTPTHVPRMLKTDEDTVSLFNLDADNVKAEQAWWLARVEGGLRIMQECPLGPNVAANLYAQHAATTNGLILSALLGAALSFSSMYSFANNMLLSFLTALGAIVVCCVAVTPTQAPEIPSFRVSQVVHGSPTEVFRLIMNSKRFQRWDAATATLRVVQQLDNNADIVYVTQRPTRLWPLWQKARDLVFMRYWRREEDGSYFVMYQSIDHPECRVRHNYVRADILGGGFVIAPQRVPSGSIRTLVTYVLRYDPGGWSRIYHQLGMDVDLVMPMLRSVIGIRDEMSATDFITPNVSMAPDGEDEEPGADRDSVVTQRTSVDSMGVVMGVQKLPTTSLPESMWAEPDASLFSVRGHNYLNDKKKIPSAPAMFHVVGVDLLSFESAAERYDISSRVDSIGRTSSKFTFVVNMIIPGPENTCMVFYFHPARDNVFEDGSPFSELLNDFFDGDDQFRNSRFKLIPTVVEGSFIIKQSVGSKPTLLGNKLKCLYYRGENYFEVDVDISSNSVANTVVGMVQGVTKSLVVDMAFLLEAQSDEELPEIILGAVRLQHVSLDNARRAPKLSPSNIES